MRGAWLAGAALVLALAVAGAQACNTGAPNPFDLLDAGLGGSTAGSGGAGGAGGATDPELGGPCTVDAQCDDGVPCTFDACNHGVDRCRFTPDDSQCQDGVYCNGVERCALAVGCEPGVPVTCSQGDPCLIASCVEADQLCSYAPRDADGDGDPDAHCNGGHDCDDTNPSVNSTVAEVCGNAIDDDCDGTVDEADCSAPAHDVCADPLVMSASGSYLVSTVAAALDYAASCALSAPGTRDVVAAVVLPPGPPVDIEVSAKTTTGANVAVALFSACSTGSELACSGSFPGTPQGHLAKVRVRGVGDPNTQTALPVYVWTDVGATVTLELQILPATAPPPNETCGTALPITSGVPVTASLIGVAHDLASACAAATGELVYTFDLATPADVDLFAGSIDGDGRPAISLRDAGCALPADEIGCQLATGAHVHRTALGAGTYYASVAASAPTDVSLDLEVSAPSTPAADETCAGAPLLAPNQTIPVSMFDHEDDLASGCVNGAVDAAYELDLAVASDVLLLGRHAQGDTTAVALAAPGCTPADMLVCGTSGLSPVRASRRNVAPGSYRAIAESALAEDMELTALVRAAVPPTIVPFADGCADALVIPPAGGFFEGTTANAHDDYPAGCDVGNGQGGPEQLLKLVLAADKRVVLDMGGSGYATLLDVRAGPGCPGTEVANGCAAGYDPSRSFLDLSLAAGTYYLQIDGYGGASGPWFLDVRVVDP